MKRILVLGIVLGAAFFLACGPKTNFGPEDVVTIHGTYLRPDHTPLRQMTTGIWTLSISGFSPSNYWFPDPDSKDVTDSTGAFEFEYKGKDLTWPGAYAKYIFVANIEPLDSAVVGLGFYPTEKDNPLPAALLWYGAPAAETASGMVNFSWRSIAETHGQSPTTYGVRARALAWFDLWRDDAVSTQYVLPVYVLQNQCTGWRVEASFPRAGDADTDYVYSSIVGHEVLTAAAPALLSKNAKCYAEGTGDTVFTKLTNQVWHELTGDENFKGGKPGFLWLDLGASRSVRAVVVYGIATSFPASAVHGGFDVFVSDDGVNWNSAVASTEKESGYFYIPIENGSARYIKLARKAGSNLRIESLKELAVFGG